MTAPNPSVFPRKIPQNPEVRTIPLRRRTRGSGNPKETEGKGKVRHQLTPRDRRQLMGSGSSSLVASADADSEDGP
eukprot:scaffold564_cov248-Pinguiococcus_pyrenoidosus.AAC.7